MQRELMVMNMGRRGMGMEKEIDGDGGKGDGSYLSSAPLYFSQARSDSSQQESISAKC